MAESTPAPVEGKTCSKCGEFKPLDQYGPRKDGRSGGRRADCRACCRARNRRWYRVDADKRGVKPNAVVVDGRKTCGGTCGELLPLSAFGSNGRGGAASSCKACKAAGERRRRGRLVAQHSAKAAAAGSHVKRCADGGELRPVADFYAAPDTLDGYRSSCKEHELARRRSRYRDPERRREVLAAAARRRALNPEYGRLYRERVRSDPALLARQRATAAARYRRLTPEQMERRRAAGAAWRRANPEKVAAWQRAWREANPDMWREKARRAAARRRARLRNLPVEPYTLEGLLARDGRLCVLCGGELDLRARRPHPKSVTIEHLECISWPASAGDVPSNVALAHYYCNQKRSDQPHAAAAAKRDELLAVEQPLT